MAFDLTANLVIPAACVFVFGTLLASRILHVSLALTVSAVKVFLPLIYFAFFFNPDWALIDGVKYFESGQTLLSAGYSPLSFLDSEALIQSMAIAGGHHVLYDWVNVLAQWLFGDTYAASVFLNVGLTFWCAYILYRIAELFGHPDGYCRGLFIFFLLHWELLSWTSIANLKDTVVLFLTLSLFFCWFSYAKLRKASRLSWAPLILFLFYWIRFYVPLLMTGAGFIWAISEMRGRKRLISIFGVALFVLIYGAALGWDGISEGAGQLALGVGMLAGAVKVMLVPRPWGIEPGYSFLSLAATLHWTMFLPTVVGAIAMWRSFPQLRVLFVYLMVVLFFYGAFEDLQGARQRLQILFIYAWAQYHFLWLVARYAHAGTHIHSPPNAAECG